MWRILNNRLYKNVGEIQYVVECKNPLEAELDVEWISYRSEMGLVQIQLCNSKHIERAIGSCNRDAKTLEDV